jgi:hypothetical protein
MLSVLKAIESLISFKMFQKQVSHVLESVLLVDFFVIWTRFGGGVKIWIIFILLKDFNKKVILHYKNKHVF